MEERIEVIEQKLKETIEMLNKHTKLLTDLVNVVNGYTSQLKELAENPSLIEEELKKQLDEKHPDWRTINIRKELNDWFGK